MDAGSSTDEGLHYELGHQDHRLRNRRRGYRTRAAGKPEISAILVPAGTDGLIVSEKYSKVGWSASDTRELSFSGCRVREDNLVGERGCGYAQFLRSLHEGRAG